MSNFANVNLVKVMRPAAAFTASAASTAVDMTDFQGPNVLFTLTSVRTSGSLTAHVQGNPAGDSGATSFYSVGTFGQTAYSAVETSTGTIQTLELDICKFPGGKAQFYATKDGTSPMSQVLGCTVIGHHN